ncbi:MAG: flagellar hook-length control protein FliK [Desulfoprunum sp.]|nr:flagellar hook-length control protein FliK [Desulfoprunum sp.]
MEAIVLASTPPPTKAAVSQSDSPMGESDSPFAPLLTQAISDKTAEKENKADTTTSQDASAGVAESLAMSHIALSLTPPPAESESGQIDIFLNAEPGTVNAFSTADLLLNTGQTARDLSANSNGVLDANGTQGKTINPLFSQAMLALTTEISTEETALPLTATLPDSPKLVQDQTATGQPPQTVQPGVLAQKQDLTLLLSQLQDIINASETKGITVQQQPQTAISLDELTHLTPQIASTAQIVENVPAAQVSQTIPAVQTAPVARIIQPPSATQVTQAVAAAQVIQTAPAVQNAPVARSLQPPSATQVTQTIAIPSGSSDTASTLEISTTNSQNIFLSDKAVEPASSKTPSLRQEIQQQYLDGKINLKEDMTKKEGNGQPSQQENANNGQNTQPFSGLSSIQGDQTGKSTFFSLPLHDTTANQQASQQGKIITLPSGVMVTEQEILNQIQQRFQMTNRMDNSRINLKLHPAELGELRIDITLKEGSIRANVVAQSQHVQELLERNMPKLRTVLQQQGFVVEDIIVTSKPETVGNFDLFGGNLPNRQAFSSTQNETFPPTSFETTLDSSMTQAAIPESGVNIRA